MGNHLRAAFAFLTIVALNTSAATLFVDLNSVNPVPPYADWSTAATNIQDAIDASTNGDLILVTNGVYATGGRVVYGSLTNRVVINKAVTLQSVNGPDVTAIQGYQIPTGSTAYSNNVRCVYVTNSAVISGFTIREGATLPTVGSGTTSFARTQLAGGGVFCESTNAILTNCVLTGNLCVSTFSLAGGGAVYQGTLNNCMLSNNLVPSYSTPGGAAYMSILNGCLMVSNSASFGGGAADSTLNYCTVIGNNAPDYGSTSWGGGTYMCIANHCLIAGNYSATAGGGDCNGILSSCVLSNNACGSSAWIGQGGGAYSSTLNNCILFGNSSQFGGGMYGGTANNCLMASNAAIIISPVAGARGGGAYGAIMNNCTVVANSSASQGGGVDESHTVQNCVIYYNSASFAPNINGGGIFTNCCTTPLPSLGRGNITNEPLFVNFAGGDYHLQSNSPCINVGDNTCVTSRTDLDGNARIVNGTVDIGAYEFQGNIRYVSLSSTNPIAPYSDWSIAATNIQDAVDAANAGDTVLVTNGTYATGGRMWYDSGTNRVTLTNAVTLRSVNGPAVTLIVGNQVAGTGSVLSNAARCVGMGNNAVLSGFTLTNGEAGWGNYPFGGGVANLVSGTSTVTNCVLLGNLSPTPYYSGGGADRVTLINSRIIGNHAGYGGGASRCTLINCTVVSNTASFSGGGVDEATLNACSVGNNAAALSGGGTYQSVLINCVLSANNGGKTGGGAQQSTLNNCLLLNNSASDAGGGAYGGTLVNCTIVSNIVWGPGAGIASATADDCILYFNTNRFNGQSPDYTSSTLNYCCTPMFPDGGVGNITNDPAFANLAAGDFHLSSNSPCINSGHNAYVTSTTDLDGNPRIVAGTADIGAYEYQTPVSRISYAWLQQYGLPITSTIDSADLDGTGFTVYQDWIAGLNPTNSLSVLAMLTPVPTNSPAGLVVSWESVSNRTYFLQSSTNLGAEAAFSTVRSNIVGQAGTTSYTDTNAVSNGRFFYRVGVQ